MTALTKEIDDFIRSNESNRTPANIFPFEKYKRLNRRLNDIHIEMAQKDNIVFLSEGIDWFRKYADILTNFLPHGEDE